MSLVNTQSEFWDKMYANGVDYTVFNQVLLDKVVTDFDIKGNVLDVGCGTGDLAVKLSKHGMNVLGIDFSKVAIKMAKERAVAEKVHPKFVNKDISNIEERFDAIFCKLVFAFIDNKEKFLNDIKEHLKNDGVFVLITPILNDSNKNLETKPGICAIEKDIQLVEKIFPNTQEYHTNYSEEGRVVKIFICRL